MTIFAEARVSGIKLHVNIPDDIKRDAWDDYVRQQLLKNWSNLYGNEVDIIYITISRTKINIITE